MKKSLNILSVLVLLIAASCSNPADRRICFFGSSVCRGVGADSLHGYAWQYAQMLPKGWSTVNLSVDGNDTYDLFARFDRDLLTDDSRFVVLGLSLGNEGLHETGEAAVLSYKENLQTLARKISELGRIPVVAGSYVRADFNPVDYEDLLNTNLEMMQWNLPTIAFLGALDDGNGRWAQGFWNESDMWHPNTAGHRELCAAIPPTFFQALAQGKPLPQRQLSDAESNISLVRFVPEKGLSSYSFSFMTNDTVCTTVYSAVRQKLWKYINTRCVVEMELPPSEIPDTFTIAGNNLHELFFFRTPLSPREVSAIVEGKMLRSSLEIYAPLTGDNPSDNLAQTLNVVELIN